MLTDSSPITSGPSTIRPAQTPTSATRTSQSALALDPLRFHYRPEIDGLRAIAVVMVVCFHAKLGVPGGFIGVDVFFVISGFLITGLILKDLKQEQFRLRDFWARRICRIVPAAFVVNIATLIFGYFLLFPEDYAELGQSVIWQQFFGANIFFWKESGYFAGASEIKPLLHFWSLAIEEQFYLFLPPILSLLFRFGKKQLGTLLLVAAATSLSASIYGVRHHPSATFFLLPTRVWELLLGSLIWWIPAHRPLSKKATSVLTALALATIGFAGCLFTHQTPFPGVAALIPCLATAVVIYVNHIETSLVARFLATRPFVAVGLISYSLYLWHWPLLAFHHYWFDDSLPISRSLLLVAMAVVLAVASYLWVETPFRKAHRQIPFRNLGLLSAVSVAILIAAGSILVVKEGIPTRIPESAARYHSTVKSAKFLTDVSLKEVLSGELPTFGNGTTPFLVWGDSHAMAYIPGLEVAANSLNLKGLQATYSSNPPVIDMVHNSRYRLSKDGLRFNEAVVEYVKRNQIKLVVLAAHWKNYANNPEFETGFNTTVAGLTSTGARVMVVLDVADQVVHVPRYFARKVFFGISTADDGIPIAQHRAENKIAETILRQVCQKYEEATCIDPSAEFVKDEIFRAEIGGQLMYRNTNHLSVEGGLHLGNWFTQQLNSMLKASIGEVD